MANYPGEVLTVAESQSLLDQVHELIKLVHEQNFQIEVLVDDSLGGVPTQSPSKEVATGAGYGAFGKLSDEIRNAKDRIFSTMDRTASFRNRLGVN